MYGVVAEVIQKSGSEMEAIVAKTLARLKWAQRVKHPRTDRAALRGKLDFARPS